MYDPILLRAIAQARQTDVAPHHRQRSHLPSRKFRSARTMLLLALSFTAGWALGAFV